MVKRKKLYIRIFALLCVGVIGIICYFCFFKTKIVQESVAGSIWKDEKEQVEAHIFWF